MKYLRIVGIVLMLAACSAQAEVKAVEKPIALAEIATTTGAAPTVVVSTTTALTNVALAGNYGFADVQVSEDFAGDFEVQTRATNNGASQGFVGMSVTMFLDGSVVGVADAFVSDWAASDTQTVTFITLDDYTEWDAWEFQVDSES